MSPAPARPRNPEDVRMTLGEHLDELRRVVIRCLVALFIGCIVCLWPSRYVLAILARPVIIVLRRNGQSESLLTTSPAESMLMWLKVALFTGLIVVLPYVLREVWGFVAAGLYEQERRWVRRMVPLSVGLFLAGAVFMYALVLTISLNFLVSFNNWIPLPSGEMNAFEQMILHAPAPSASSQPGAPVVSVPLRTSDPEAPASGDLWFNVHDSRLRLFVDGQKYSLQFQPDATRGLIAAHFRLSEYVSFVLVMMLAFGIAFQTPLAVVVLARTGIIKIETIRAYRKVVWLVIVFIAGILAPPDLVSHLMLSIPMVALFELGMYIASSRVPPSTAIVPKKTTDS